LQKQLSNPRHGAVCGWSND